MRVHAFKLSMYIRMHTDLGACVYVCTMVYSDNSYEYKLLYLNSLQIINYEINEFLFYFILLDWKEKEFFNYDKSISKNNYNRF